MDLGQTLNGWVRRIPVWPIYLIAALPPAWLFWQGLQGNLGADPVKAIERQMGELALQLIVAGLCITPVRRFWGVNLIRYRRAIGIVTFSYVALHFLTWVVLDMGLLLDQALSDILKRPYVTVGMAAMVLMLPLVATSNNWSVRRLGAARWNRLHKLTYPAAILGAIHYIWLVKAWPLEPFLYLGAILLLLALRARPKGKSRPVAA